MAGGGLALVIVPPLTDATSWRATYVLCARSPVAAAVPDRTRARSSPRRRVAARRPRRPEATAARRPAGRNVRARRDRRQLVVPLLERQDASSALAGTLGGLVLLAGIVTRPLGGGAVHRRPADRRRCSWARSSRSPPARCSSRRAGRPGSRVSARSASALRRGSPSRLSSRRRSGCVQTRPGRRSRSSTRAPYSRCSSGRRSRASPSAPRRRPDRIRGDRLSRRCRAAVRRTLPPTDRAGGNGGDRRY